MDLTTFLWTALSTVFVACIIRFIFWRLAHRFPPGPWGLPLLGYKPFLSRNPSEDYLKLTEKYGPIIGLRLGTRYAVILNKFEDIKEAFNRPEFLDRPPDWLKISENSDNVANMNGWEWKETRRLTVSTLRNLGVGKNRIEEKITEEIAQVLSRLEKDAPSTEINLMDLFYLPLLNVILTIMCGRPFDDGDGLLKALSQYNEDTLHLALTNQKKIYYPFSKPFLWLKNLLRTKHTSSLTEMEKFLRKEAQGHEINFDEDHLEDFMSYYIRDMRANISKRTSLNAANLQGNSEILLFAGTDTTRTTLSWNILYLAQHQDVQEKIYREITELIGKERTPAWSDRESLPYTEAFILESARFKTLVPADDPHWSSMDGEIGGYFVPKGSIIIANILAVHEDKKLWGDPENFRPERFLSLDGKKTITPEYWIPFLIGKRACPGTKLANMQLFLFVTSIVQRFRLIAPRSGLNLESQFFFMDFPAKPVVAFELRN